VVADWLNKVDGVWQQRILPPNKSKRDMPSAIVRETSFVSSLKPVLRTPYFVRQDEKTAAELLRRFWEAVRLVFPEAFEDPDAYVIQKTPGVFSLHELAPEVFELARDKGDVSVENLTNILQPVRELDSDGLFWLADSDDGAAQYGSMKGFGILAANMRQYLPMLARQ